MDDFNRKSDRAGFRPAVPESGALRGKALDLLRRETNRLSLALGMMLCLALSVGIFFLLYTCMDLFFGREAEEWSYELYYLAESGLMLAGVLLSLPVYHGYRICAANLAQTGRLQLWDLFTPYAGAGQFFSALLNEALVMLPYGITFGLNVFAMAEESVPLLFLAYAVFPLTYFLTGFFRRVCRIHACFSDEGLRFAFRTARMCPKALRSVRKKLTWSGFPHLLLSLVTLLIYGLYRAFAQYELAASLLYLQTVEILPRKDIQS